MGRFSYCASAGQLMTAVYVPEVTVEPEVIKVHHVCASCITAAFTRRH